MTVTSPTELTMRLGVAALCGLLVGLDREFKYKNVGVRTYLLVCIGSAAFTLAVIEMAHFYAVNYKDMGADPTRVVQGIVTGIGFLGGGAILHSKGNVTGAATGASIWVSGSIGVACGYGFYWLAGITTIYTFVILFVVGNLRSKLRDDIDEDKGDVPNNSAQ